MDLADAVDALVETVTSGAKGKALQKAVAAVVDAFDAADAKAARAALKKLDASLERSEGQASQILELTIGALVEAGAPPEAAWPSVSRELETALEGASAFAMACAKAAKTAHVESALAKAGAKIAKKMPDEAAAWQALPSRCLAAVACLTRSKKVRAAARKDHLDEKVYTLEDAVAEVGFLSQALRILDDATILVIHPDLGRGFRLKASEIGANAELFVLLVDAILADKKSGLPGDRFDARAVAAIKGDAEPPKGVALVAPFNFVSWDALAPDGTLPPAHEIEDHWLWFEGAPSDIPEHGGTPIILLQDPPHPRILPLERAFEGLSPSVKLEKKLSPAEVKKLLTSLAKAARKRRR